MSKHPPPGTEPVTIRLTSQVFKLLRKIADDERRPVSSMGRLLIEEALVERAVLKPNHR